MKDFLTDLVKLIVDHPEEVSVSEIDNNGYLTLKLKVAQDDMGRVIGKSGKIIRALRDLVKVRAIKEKKQAMVELIENQ